MFSDESSSITQPRGRRVFGKKGEILKEVNNFGLLFAPSVVLITAKATAEQPPQDTERHMTGSGADSTTPSGKGRKIHPRPITISAAGSSGGYLKGFDQLKQPRARDASSMAAPTKSARQMLFEAGDVGEDLRRPQKAAGGTGSTGARSSSTSTNTRPPQGFMKPAGVDEPVRTPSVSNKTSAEKPHSHDKKSKRKRLSSQSEQTPDSGTKKLKTDEQSMT